MSGRPQKKRKVQFDEDEYEEIHVRDVRDASRIRDIYNGHNYPKKDRLVQKYIFNNKISMRNERFKFHELMRCTKPGTAFGFKWSITFHYQANMTTRNNDGVLNYNDSDRTFEWFILHHDDSNFNDGNPDFLSRNSIPYAHRVLFYDIEIMERLWLHDKIYNVPEMSAQLGVPQHDISQDVMLTSFEGTLSGLGETGVNLTVDAHNIIMDMDSFNVTKRCIAFDRGNYGTGIWKTIKAKGSSQIQRKFGLNEYLMFEVTGQEDSQFDMDIWCTIQVFFKFDN